MLKLTKILKPFRRFKIKRLTKRLKRLAHLNWRKRADRPLIIVTSLAIVFFILGLTLFSQQVAIIYDGLVNKSQNLLPFMRKDKAAQETTGANDDSQTNDPNSQATGTKKSPNSGSGGSGGNSSPFVDDSFRASYSSLSLVDESFVSTDPVGWVCKLKASFNITVTAASTVVLTVENDTRNAENPSAGNYGGNTSITFNGNSTKAYERAMEFSTGSLTGTATVHIKVKDQTGKVIKDFGSRTETCDGSSGGSLN